MGRSKESERRREKEECRQVQRRVKQAGEIEFSPLLIKAARHLIHSLCLPTFAVIRNFSSISLECNAAGMAAMHKWDIKSHRQPRLLRNPMPRTPTPTPTWTWTRTQPQSHDTY